MVMEAVQVEELTSGASGRIIPVFHNIRGSIPTYQNFKQALILFYSTFICFLFLLVPHRRSSSASSSSTSSLPSYSSLPSQLPKSPSVKRRSATVGFGGGWKYVEDSMRRRALAETFDMNPGNAGGDDDGRLGGCVCRTQLFYGVGQNALFYRSWFPKSGDLKGIIIIIHGLNEHGGRYARFAGQLTACNFGVYAMDWTGHGGSDGLHGYVPSLDHVVADTVSFLEKINVENPGIPCFLLGHSTGGAVVLKASLIPHVRQMLEGIVLTAPALRVQPVHPMVGVVAPIISMLAPTYQFKGGNKKGIAVSRDPAQLRAKYSDPLVYTGPIRVRTGHEILRITSYLTQNFKYVSVPFFVLHGTADGVTDPMASQDLYNEAASEYKDMKLYEGFLHDLLFEPERDEVAQDIIDWLIKKLSAAA